MEKKGPTLATLTPSSLSLACQYWYTYAVIGQCVVHRLGLVPYPQAWQLQEQIAGQIGHGEQPPTLLLLEHPHVYTFGRRGNAKNLVWDELELARRGVSVMWVDRGGDVTYHGPGQLVGYPLLPLAPGGLYAARPGADRNPKKKNLPQADYVGYIRKLEQALILALRRLGVAGDRISGLTGVWVQPDELLRCRDGTPQSSQLPAKIAAIGVKVDARGVSRHGFALIVDMDMCYWQGIIGCGLKDYPVTSVAELCSPPPKMDYVIDAVVTAIGEVFDYEMVVESTKL
jgi:lipoyl(octanoyl) transferase